MATDASETVRTVDAVVTEDPAAEPGRLPAPPPAALVIFGATGDLTKRKLVPALYALAVDGLLPKHFTVIGAARSELTDDQFRTAMRDAVTRFARLRLDEEVWSRFAEGLHYASFSDRDGGLDGVKRALESADRERGTAGNRIYYFAIPPIGFAPPDARPSAAKGAVETEDGEGGTAGTRIYSFATPPIGFAPLAERLQHEGMS